MVIAVDWLTWRPISPTEFVISSVADATDCTLDATCCEAAATDADSNWVVFAVLVNVPADVSNRPDAADTALTISPTTATKPSVTLRTDV